MTQAPLRIGLIARADNSGLGVQTHNFFKFMHPARTMVVDIGHLNGNKSYLERYNSKDSEQLYVNGFPKNDQVDAFLRGLDVVFIAEAAYNPYVYIRAKELGVKTANQYNYEFFDWYDASQPRPDLLIAPSKWHYLEVDNFCRANGLKHVYLHCPVDRAALPFRVRRQARSFLHPAGRSAAHDRNGTMAVIKATKYIESDVTVRIHFQGEQGLRHQLTNTIDEYLVFAEIHGDLNKLVITTHDYTNYADVYAGNDVLVLPRRYGGNCLPMNEALSSGMPVIMSDVSPNENLLPNNWLVPAIKVGQFTPRTTVDLYDAQVTKLAGVIDYFAGLDKFDMESESLLSNEIAQEISWDVMRQKYLSAFQELVNG